LSSSQVDENDDESKGMPHDDKALEDMLGCSSAKVCCRKIFGRFKKIVWLFLKILLKRSK
jgi:hypothetical protein